MLISNKSYVEKIVHIRLKFDDGTIKSNILKKGSIGYITFRHNDRLIKEYGVVKDITDSLHYDLDNHTRESVCINFDTSRKFKSEHYNIALNDIVDIELVPELEAIGPDRGEMSMRIYGENEGRRKHTWHPFNPRKEKK